MRIFLVLIGIILLAFVITKHIPDLNLQFNNRTGEEVNIKVDSIFGEPVKGGKLKNKSIDEASGLAVSIQYPNLLYTHNDSGGKPIIYKLDEKGNDLGTIKLEYITNRDWEDIAISYDSISGKSHIYVGEFGDNNGVYRSIYIYRVEEPSPDSIKITVIPDIFELKYPNGPRDSETLMFDPQTSNLYIVSKREKRNIIYKVSNDNLVSGKISVLDSVGTLPIKMPTAGDISPDGYEILIKNYKNVFYWKREPGELIEETLTRKPKILPYEPEPQGEAIAFNANASAYFTLSEVKNKVKPVLYKYYRNPSTEKDFEPENKMKKVNPE